MGTLSDCAKKRPLTRQRERWYAVRRKRTQELKRPCVLFLHPSGELTKASISGGGGVKFVVYIAQSHLPPAGCHRSHTWQLLFFQGLGCSLISYLQAARRFFWWQPRRIATGRALRDRQSPGLSERTGRKRRCPSAAALVSHPDRHICMLHQPRPHHS